MKNNNNNHIQIPVDYFDTQTLEIKKAEMYIEGYKANLVKDTSYKGLWRTKKK